MRYFTKGMVAFSLLLAAANAVPACELPAHPNAAAMPVGITLRGSDTEQKVSDCSAVKLVQGTNDASFYYLIPEGSKVKLRIVWDPVCHNNPSPVDSDDFKYKAEQYDYVYSAELKIKEDQEIGLVGGYYFFPLKAMSEYFTLSGNRKDAKEAFSREYGSIGESDEIIADAAGVGPASIFSTSFATTGAKDLGFSIVGGTTKNYSDSDPAIQPTKISDIEGIDPIDSYLPGPHWNLKDTENDIFLLEEGKIKLVNRGAPSTKPTWGYKAIDDKKDEIVVYTLGKSGVDMSNMDFGLKEPDPKNYKAYIVENGNKKQIHVEGIGYDKDADDCPHGDDSDCSFYVTFTTPSIGGDNATNTEDDAIVKIMVNSPPAGYNLTNLFWVWEEQTYKRVKSGKYALTDDSEKPSIMPDGSTDDDADKEKDSDTDKDKEKDDEESAASDSDEDKDEDKSEDSKEEDSKDTSSQIVLDASDEKYYIYQKSGSSKKCSCGLGIVVCKTQDGIGYAAYKIYDDCGPVTSNLQVSGTESSSEPKYFEEDGNTTNVTSKFNFSIDLIDSNPYFAKDIALSDANEKFSSSKDISQSKEKMSLTFFYNYPVYDYKTQEKTNAADLKGVGLVDFPESNKDGKEAKFNAYTHDTKWFWHKAETVEISSVECTKEIHADSAADKDQRLIGSVNTVKGTFEIKNPKPWHEKDGDDNKNFTVFAVFKDTAGNTHVSEVFNYTPKKMESAKPENLADKNYAMDPTKETVSELAANDDTTAAYAPHFAKDLGSQASWEGKYWQSVSHLESDDVTAPEIQVIVLDTRTNRYHIFGTSENTAAGLNKMKVRNTDTTYAGLKVEDVPYINKNTAITNSYKYEKFEDINALFNTYLQGTDAVSTIMDITNKNGFVCQKNSRLVFYPRAFDNIGYMETNGGVQSFRATLYDTNSTKRFEEKSVTSMDTPIENVFRQENVDASNNVTPYVLKVEATDYSNNTREFYLNIAVTGRTLDIRTLEEKRERVK